MFTELSGIAKMLIGIGALIVVLGVLLWLSTRLPGLGFLGKLPGDIIIKRDNFTFYFPLATSLLLSIILSLLAWFLFRR